MLGLGVLVFILIMFLPAIFELRMPKDAGPRIIRDYSSPTSLSMEGILIANLEERGEFDQILVKRMVEAINVLPNLEV